MKLPAKKCSIYSFYLDNKSSGGVICFFLRSVVQCLHILAPAR